MRINRTQRTLIRPRVPVHKAHRGNHLPVWRSSPQPSRPQRAPAAPSAPAKSPIAPAEPGAPLPALSFLGGFRTTAPVLVASSEMGRHPKPVTKGAELAPRRHVRFTSNRVTSFRPAAQALLGPPRAYLRRASRVES